jgi:hypothetical protein
MYELLLTVLHLTQLHSLDTPLFLTVLVKGTCFFVQILNNSHTYVKFDF